MTLPTLNGDAVLLRIYLGESDRWQGSELYEAIVKEARKHGLVGATVLRGILSYGANRHFHTTKLLDLSADLPVVIEIIDAEGKIHDFLTKLDPMIEKSGCLVTLKKVQVYRHQRKS